MQAHHCCAPGHVEVRQLREAAELADIARQRVEYRPATVQIEPGHGLVVLVALHAAPLVLAWVVGSNSQPRLEAVAVAGALKGQQRLAVGGRADLLDLVSPSFWAVEFIQMQLSIFCMPNRK